ncbi:MAG: DNA repair protein RadA [Peptostreptococcaceae bacterium]|nr:DNA repair protein RadA [Peptostreptococcaceae bacterium]
MKTKTIYRCSQCEKESVKWSARCFECGAYGTMEEFEVSAKSKSSAKVSSAITRDPAVPTIRLTDVKMENSNRIISSLNEFNRVMGGGIVRDSVTIITAKPGAGKSTLLLQVAQDIALQGLKVLYASGEESDSQIKSRAERILRNISENIWVITDHSMDHVLEQIETLDPDLIIIDSIQTFTMEEHLPSRAGSPTQTMECANAMVRIAKNKKRPRAVIFVGQMNKNEEMAGLRALEHLVDTVLVIEGESEEELRELQSTKNRFGSTGEMGFFTMTEEGLISIDNPSEYFMTIRDEKDRVSGSALTVVREGTRPVILEIESLVSTSFMPYPTRIAEGLKRDQLNILISILEQRARFNLLNKNVVIKTTGGLKVKENAINLGIIMSIVSSFSEKPIPNNYVFIGDVGLTGELKKVPSMEQRVRELDRMGFDKVYVAKGAFNRRIDFDHIKVVEKKTLQEVISDVFGQVEHFKK